MTGVSVGDERAAIAGGDGGDERAAIADAGGGCELSRHFFVVKSGAGAYGTVQVNFTKEEVRK